jgi:hypothetical protein
MSGEQNLMKLLATLQPELHSGDFVFCSVENTTRIGDEETVMVFREAEGVTVIMEKERADRLGLRYGYVAAWITLSVHSSLEAIGLTAAFSGALAAAGISCNVVAGFYHDHIFVGRADAANAMEVLKEVRGGVPLE